MTNQTQVEDERLKAPAAVAKPELSVIILSYNEETNLPECLKSLQGLSCRIFVVDSFSTDRTPEIARAAGATFLQHPFENYATQRNWSQDNLPIDTPWILHLDADERLTPELVSEIRLMLDNSPVDIAGFLLRKRTIFMGRWIRHGGHYPSYHLRLFRAGSGRCEDRLYDQHFIAAGKLECLHYDYLDVVASTLSSWTLRHARWAEAESREMLTAGVKHHQVAPHLFGNPIQRRRCWRNGYSQLPLFFRVVLYYFYRYFVRRGFLDGVEGLIFHFLQGFWFRFQVDALIWERTRRRSR